ncbi:mucin-5AC-like [Ascaphus truei]|uniref:mucin-5AC-like n=1 Tax=Ascaphus truei TaxID=8439 RepID=UPI003F5AC4B8
MGTFNRIPLWILLLVSGPLNAQSQYNYGSEEVIDYTDDIVIQQQQDILVTGPPRISVIPVLPTTPVVKAINTAHNNRVCSTWGNFHFKNFDGDVFHFPGTCNYLYSSHCKSTYEDFNIQIRRAVVNNAPVIDRITMKIDGMVVEINPNSVVVNGQTVQLPFSGSGVQIEKNGVYLKVSSKLGLVFMWNDDDSLLLELDEKYANQTCGLCGDYNSISIHNEFMSNGVQVTETQFGNLQKMDGPTEQCQDAPPTPKSNCTDYENICEGILLGSAFAKCHSLVGVEKYIEACVQDLCGCDSKMTSICLCNTFSEYSRQCAHAGGQPENWRTPELCPMKCAFNMEYQECGSPCADTCSNPERGVLCEDHCLEGCFCPAGTVFDDINNSGCVPIDKCSCTYNSDTYASGTSYSTSCSTCVCSAGRWNCKNMPCPATCAVEGGSHITTYDQTHYNVHGDCNYVLSKVCGENTFTVVAELRKCGLTDSETCLKSAIIILDGGETIVIIKPCGSVYVNRIYTQLPVSAANVTIFRPSSFYIIVQTQLGAQIVAQLTPFMQIYVVLDPSFKNKTCGLCGNFNDKQTDDFQTMNGVIEGTAAAFANTWKTQADCPNVQNIYEDPCSLSVENEKYAQHWCGLITDPSGFFAPCHSQVNPEVYQQNCMFDTCNCEKSEDCMCAALSSYVRACAAKGVILTGWRSNVCNKYINTCPKSLNYTYSVSTCQPTCRSLSEPDVTCSIKFVPVDGCACSKDFYMDDSGKCVPAAVCPCYYRGSPVPSGEVIHDNGILCTCTQGKLSCIGTPQPACSAPMVYFDCKNATVGTRGAECQKSCQTLDMECYSTKCISGCVCPQGLVSDGKGSCIEEEKCPCIHNDATYQPGEKIKMNCNTCTCKDRMWQCTNNPCLGTCAVYGDGHYITFDGKRYSFSGDCEYTLAQDHCGQGGKSSTFRVITENIPCGTTGTTCSKAIKVFLGSYELILTDDHIDVVERGIGADVPYTVRHMGIYLVIEADNGLILMWDKRTSIFIKLSSDFEGKVCGLCGNYDGNGNNDFTTRSMSVIRDVIEFGNSWKLSPTCPDAKDTKDSCSTNPYRKSWAQKQCSIINSKAFSACHAQVDPSKYYDACVTDSCACDTGGDCECFCTAIAAYAQACGESGFCVSWRTPNICPLFCDYYNPEGECEWHYKPCGAPCMKTCRNPSGKCLHELSGLEGCYPSCPAVKPYFDEDDMECVAECGCYDDDDDEKHYKLGSPVATKENCKSCECTMSGIDCKYNKEACHCEYKGKMYKYNDVIYNTTDGIGGCISAICKENGTIYRDIYPCPALSTTPFTFTTTPATTTKGTTTPTPITTICVKELCQWSRWFDVSYPKAGMENGDFDTFENIKAKGFSLCNHPQDVECRAERFPDTPLAELEQNVHCNSSFGLICYNKEQLPPICYNYEIRVQCCSFVPCNVETSTTEKSTTSVETTPTITTPPATTTKETTTSTHPTTTKETTTSTPPATTTIAIPPTSTETPTSPTTVSLSTPSTPIITTTTLSTTSPTTTVPSTTGCQPTCRWTPWIDVHMPGLGKDEGDFETYEKIRAAGKQICPKPDGIQCRAEKFPQEPIGRIGQVVQCNLTIGLVCKNEEQEGDFKVCLNYQVKVLCCNDYSRCLSTTTAPPTTPETTTPETTTATTTPATTHSETTTTSTTTAPPTTPETTTPETTTTTTTPTTTHSETTTTSTTTTPETTITTTPESTTTIGTPITSVVTTTPETITTTETTTPPTTTETTTSTTTTIETPTPTPETTTTTTTQPTTHSETTTTPETTITTTTESTTTPGTTTTSVITDTTTVTPTTTETITTTTPITTTTTESTTAPVTTTIPTTTTSTTEITTSPSTTTAPTTASSTTPNCQPQCKWTTWLDVDTPTSGRDGGDIETYNNIITKGKHICKNPQNIECRAEDYPDISIDNVGQVVQCDITVGLICNNKDQSGKVKQCYNYQIKVLCCDDYSHCSTTTPATTTPTIPTTTISTTTPPTTTETTTSTTTIETPTPTTETTTTTTTQPTTHLETTTTPETTITTTTESTTTPVITTTTTTTTTVPPTTTETIPTTTPITTTTTEPTTTPITTTIPTTTTSTTEITSSPLTTTAPSTTATSTTPNCQPQCKWTTWLDVDTPTSGRDGGDIETYNNIITKGKHICKNPQNIECRAEDYPDISIDNVGQVVQCDITVGLICNNKDQSGKVKQCYNYQIKVLCCDDYSHCSTTTPPTTTPTIPTTTISTTTPPTTTETTTSTTTIETPTPTPETTTTTTTQPTTHLETTTTPETTITTTTESTTTPVITTTTTTTTVPPTTTETIPTTTPITTTTTEPTTTPITTTIPTTTTSTTEITSSPLTTTAPSTTATSTTPNCQPQCKWTTWLDVDTPTSGRDGGDIETYNNIITKGKHICKNPQNIECRAEDYPDISIDNVGQVVQCDITVGLICNNKDQSGKVKQCYNYQIKVLCCDDFSHCSTTTPPTTTPTIPTTTISTTTPPTTTETTTSTTTIETPTPTPETTTTTTTQPTTHSETTTTPETTITTTTESTATPGTTTTSVITTTTTTTVPPTTTETIPITTPITTTTTKSTTTPVTTTIPTTTTSTTEITSSPSTTTAPSTTETSTTPNCQPQCKWTTWFDVDTPTSGRDGGDSETYNNIIAKGKHICKNPQNIQCRAEEYPDISIDNIGQVVQCDVTVGLICNNKDQSGKVKQCYNYQIKVLCCDDYSHCSTTTPATTTPTIPTTTISTTTHPTTTETTTSTTTIETPTPTPETTTTTTTQPTTHSETTTTPETTITTTTESTATPGTTTTSVITTTTTTTVPPTTTETIPITTPITTTTTKSTTTPVTTTIPTTTTSTTEITTSPSTTTAPTTASSITPNCQPQCKWTTWLDVDTPTSGRNGGDSETYNNIIAKGKHICKKPQDIECRAEEYPDISIDNIGQVVQCDVTVGLICKNNDQSGKVKQCYNYQIKVLCCDDYSHCSTTTPATTTPTIPTTTISTTTPPTTTETTTSTTTIETPTPTTETTTTTTTQPTTHSETTTTPETTITTTTESTTTSPSTTTAHSRITTLETPKTENVVQTTTKPVTDNIVVPTTPEITSRVLTTTAPATTTSETTHTTEITPTTTIETTITEKTTTTTISTTATPTTTTTESTTTETPTTTPASTTIITETSALTPTAYCLPKCQWSSWIDVDHPSSGIKGGDIETYENIISEGKSICKRPSQIQCRAENFPAISIDKLGQNVQCNVSFGLLCKNEDQDGELKMCYNYEIRVLCCDDYSHCKPSHLTTIPSTPSTTTSTTEATSTSSTTSSTVTTMSPTTTSTSKTTPATTTVSTTTTSETSTTTLLSTTSAETLSPPPTPTSQTTTRQTTTPFISTTTHCFCHVDKSFFKPGEVIYNKTDEAGCRFYAICSDVCEPERFQGSCSPTTTPKPTTTTPASTTTKPSTSTSTSTTTPSIITTTPIPGCPPRKTNETWVINNCTVATCQGNNVVTIEPVKCPPVEKVSCTNGFPPVKVYSSDGCCFHYECECVCSGWGDPHYITFDGTYYTFLDNCTYVLVQQITPKYDNFRILIDNYFCGAEDGLSCPQSLLIYYGSNEVVLTRVMYKGRMTNRIRFNQDWVTPGFTRDGITISSAGINMVVEIPEIKAYISFSGMIFVVKLPFSKFGHNTEGQCGTCSNNSTEDCRLPNGRIIADCSKMAPHWKVNVTDKPYCNVPPPSPTPSPGTPTSPPICPASPLCDVILSEVFAACHKKIPPKPYHDGCIFDACRIRNDSVQCSSLEIYATLCIANGVCVDWRGKTGGHCPYKCPAGKDYKACGPMHTTTCDSNEVQVSDGLTEGCFCPAGTKLFNSYTDVCVKSCSCVGPDGMPKKAAETWISNCQECVCEANSLTVQCKPMKCLEPPSISCKKEGLIVVHVPDPHQPCCMLNECQCNVSYCSNQARSCPLGFEVVPVLIEGDCCATYDCKPMEVCVIHAAIYQPGHPIPPNKDSCEDCRCTHEKDTKTSLNLVACNPFPCQTQCPPGYQYMKTVDQCCGICQQVGCTMNIDDNSTVVIQPGETWSSPIDKCSYYKCNQTEEQYFLVRVITECAVSSADECKSGFEYKMPEGECCGTCEQVACTMKMKDNSTKVLKPGETWTPPHELCLHYECHQIEDQFVPVTVKRTCAIVDCEAGFEYKIKSGECCGECTKVACTMKMGDNTTKVLQPGETFNPPEDKCTSYKCTEAYDVVTMKEKCPAFDPTQCKEGTIKMTADGCCKTCEAGCLVRKQSTRIKTTTCESDQSVELSYCEGACKTSSIYSADANTMEHKCSCCQEMKTSKREVSLKCLDGTTELYSYIYVDQCGCTRTACERDSQISQSQQQQNSESK